MSKASLNPSRDVLIKPLVRSSSFANAGVCTNPSRVSTLLPNRSKSLSISSSEVTSHSPKSIPSKGSKSFLTSLPNLSV